MPSFLKSFDLHPHANVMAFNCYNEIAVYRIGSGRRYHGMQVKGTKMFETQNDIYSTLSFPLHETSTTELVAGTFRGKVFLLDFNHRGRVVKKYVMGYEKRGEVHPVTTNLLLDRKDLFCGTQQGSIRIYDTRTPEIITTLHTNPSPAESAPISHLTRDPANKNLILATQANQLTKWDLRNLRDMESMAVVTDNES